MDFSSVPRALDSLFRRQPALDESTLACATQLKIVNKDDNDNSDKWCSALQPLLQQQHTERWEPLAVALYLCTEVLLQYEAQHPAVYMDGPRVPSTNKSVIPNIATTPTLTDAQRNTLLIPTLHKTCLAHLEHKEPRVRTLVAKAVGAYAAADPALADELYQRLWTSIDQHIQTGRPEEKEQEEKQQEQQQQQQQQNEEEDDTNQDKDNQAYSRSSTGALDDTTGWRALETNWLCLASLIRALGPAYLKRFPLTEQFLQYCQYSCVTHLNRHVRAAAISVLEQLVHAAAAENDDNQDDTAAAENDDNQDDTTTTVTITLLTSKTSPLRKTLQTVLKTGLADNWSQVRMAASVLCRVVFTELPQPYHKELFPALLPRMCLNRFYLAQGVKLYSHETWKLIFPQGAQPTLEAFLPAVCRYYVQMCDADNHVVREAACQAIAELATRLQHDTLESHVPTLLQALLMCFHDESWPVRDEACLACAHLAKAFPTQCHPELPTLWSRWTEELTDQIWSVRQDAAIALGEAIEAFPDEVWPRIQNELLPKILPAARSQPAMTPEEYKAHVQDIEAHTDSQLYSCGSLAPKLKKKAGAGRIGCTNCAIDRPKSPWEATDGSIYLIRELCLKKALASDETPKSKVHITDDTLLPLLTELADVCRVQHFPQADDLRCTLWRQLPIMATAIGKQHFKRMYLEVFLPLLSRDLRKSSSTAQLTYHAAGQCAEELGRLVGMGILRGRMDMLGAAEDLDRVLQERRQQVPGPANDDVFSPFGPPGLLDHIHGKTGTTLHPGIAAMGRFP